MVTRSESMNSKRLDQFFKASLKNAKPGYLIGKIVKHINSDLNAFIRVRVPFPTC